MGLGVRKLSWIAQRTKKRKKELLSNMKIVSATKYPKAVENDVILI